VKEILPSLVSHVHLYQQYNTRGLARGKVEQWCSVHNGELWELGDLHGGMEEFEIEQCKLL